jgi:hypothetical protein
MGKKRIVEAKIKKITVEDTVKEVNKTLVNPLIFSYILVIGLQAHSSEKKKNALAPILGNPRFVGEGSKLMFVHQALRRMNLNKVTIKFEVLLCNSSIRLHEYTQAQTASIKKAVKSYDGTLTEVKTAQEIINYINTGDKTKKDNISSIRKSKPIKQLLFYSHGLPGELALGMPPAGNTTDLSIEEKEVKKLNREAFAPDAGIYSFACRTGLGNPEVDDSVYINPGGSTADPANRYNLLSSESLAQKLADQTGAVVFAYLCRSDYSETLFTNDELCFSDHMKVKKGELSSVSKLCGNTYKYLLDKTYTLTKEENERWKKWREIESNLQYIDGAWFDPDGARNPVKGGITPAGTPRDMKTYKPRKK